MSKLRSEAQVNVTPFLKFTLINMRSLKPKSLLVRGKITRENADSFMFTETWLTDCAGACIAECFPPGFSLHHVCRTKKLGEVFG